jgi:hypothetical protein
MVDGTLSGDAMPRVYQFFIAATETVSCPNFVY